MCSQKTIAWQPLRTAQQFTAVMQRGRVVARSAHFFIHALCLAHTPTTTAWFAPTSARFCGMLLSKRWAHTAVRRNLIKRQIRSILNQPPPVLTLPNSHIVLIVRLHSGWDSQQFHSAASNTLQTAVRQELLALFKHARWHKAPVFDIATKERPL